MQRQEAPLPQHVGFRLSLQRDVRCQRAQRFDAHRKATRGDGGEPGGISSA